MGQLGPKKGDAKDGNLGVAEIGFGDIKRSLASKSPEDDRSISLFTRVAIRYASLTPRMLAVPPKPHSSFRVSPPSRSPNNGLQRSSCASKEWNEIGRLSGDIAQLVERIHGMDEVLGSNPCISTELSGFLLFANSPPLEPLKNNHEASDSTSVIPPFSMPGLVLTGGGARAAYQAGVLLGISDVLGPDAPSPFPILTGVSAGAINGSFLASQASNNWRDSVTALSELWRNLSFEQIFRTNTGTFASLGTRWIRDLGMGAVLGRPRSTHLLDSSPLQALLSKHVDFAAISANLAAGKLHGVGISVTSYKTGTAITFYDGNPAIRTWSRTSRLGMRDSLTLEHVLASASIPLFFKPIRIGNAFYGDGGVRLSSPLSPAIHLGSSRILAIAFAIRARSNKRAS